ncbi:MAG TPA: hydantoin racemase [Ignisphaera aggregans]|uniref:Hydantoin racemase n=1 Tax=Ignisphaera aggregans TaxID=334771 RepID=A0A833DVC5_9CREN|nr:hydantoin racemase [Ignisphaera aggregans]
MLPILGTISVFKLNLFELSLILYLVAIVIGIASRGSKAGANLSFAITALAALLLLPIPFIYGFLSAEPIELSLWMFGTSIPIYIDALSAVLIFVISILTLTSSIYSISYMEYYHEIGMFGYFAALFSLFSVSMILVVTVNSALWFLFMWEVMTLASYFLINWEYVEESVRRAAWKYFISMHFLSTLPLVLAIAALVTITGVDSLTELRTVTPTLDPRLIAVLHLLFLIGFGAKAGAVPLHFWLPDAHPAAPSNVSALLSGAMIKVAVYGLLRFCAFVLPISYVLGLAIAVIGTISLMVGTLTALRQTDAKRLLAYHSVGQMGYIWLGVGTGLALAAIGNPLAVVGLVAGLYHLINHALFKGLLFLSAGSILFRTRTRDLNVIGGLARYMPYTAALTLIAALSIAGVPPFNGFVSKWLIYESTFLSGNGILVFCGVMALFISAATLASFIKFYTTAFGGVPKVESREVPSSMLFGKSILAALCIITGVIPITVLNLLLAASKTIAPIAPPTALTVTISFVTVAGISTFIPLLLIVTMAVLLLLGFAIAVPRGRVVAPWDCGERVELKHYKLLALHYYRTYEEYIHALYELSHKLSEGFGHALIKTAYFLANASNTVATTLSRRITGAALSRAMKALASASDAMASALSGKAIGNALSRIMWALATASDAVASTLSGKAISSALSRVMQALAIASDAVATALTRASVSMVRGIGEFVLHNLKEFYADEAVFSSVVNALHGIARFLAWTVLRTDINTFMSYSALFILMISLLVIALVVGVTP